MQTYITQLIEDLETAQCKEHALNKNLVAEDFEAYVTEFERYIIGDAQQPIRTVIGFNEEQFPPANQLNEEQLNAVSDALLECLYSWNICIDMPDRLPAPLRYKALVDALQLNVVIVSSGFIHLELCSYDSACCPFGTEFCRCVDCDEDI